MEIGTYGLVPQTWQSVGRTLRFFREALDGSGHRLAPLDELISVPEGIDIILRFSPPGRNDIDPTFPGPIAFCVHGGAVLDTEWLKEQFGSAHAGRRIAIVNCDSDVAVIGALSVSGLEVEKLKLPVDTNVFSPRDRPRSRAACGVPPDAFCIGIVSRLLPQKNVHVAIEMVAALKARRPGKNICIVIVGDFWADYPVLDFGTDYRAHISSLLVSLGLAEAAIYFQGNLSESDLITVMCSMDVLLHPTASIDENFGYVAVEAMALGVPVVGNAYGGLKDTVSEGITGFLADTWLSNTGIREDRGKLVRSLQLLLDDPKLRLKLSRRSIDRARQDYSVAEFNRRLVTLLEDAGLQHGGARLNLEVNAGEAISVECRDDLLFPAKHDRLSQYAFAICRYVSRTTPGALESKLLGAFASFTLSEDGVATMHSPAYPLKRQLSRAERDLLLACRPFLHVDELSDWQVKIADGLMEDGLLVPHAGAQLP